MGLIVTITEQSGNDLTDYQVRVEVTDPAFFQLSWYTDLVIDERKVLN